MVVLDRLGALAIIGHRPSLLSLIVKSAGHALDRVAAANVLIPETVMPPRPANILVFPNGEGGPAVLLRDVAGSGLWEIEKRLASPIGPEAVPAKGSSGTELTIVDFGPTGVTHATSVVQLPHSAVLSLGTPVARPSVHNGQLAIRTAMTVSMTCDRRAIDGAGGARFLGALKTFLQHPETLLL
jgi:pyruvate dehydrogenase E2 component (dihydrolipoamide acetyltransferase)